MEKWQIYLQETSTQIEFAKCSYAAFQSAEAGDSVVDVFLNSDRLFHWRSKAGRLLWSLA
jgi:hypothetical protein